MSDANDMDDEMDDEMDDDGELKGRKIARELTAEERAEFDHPGFDHAPAAWGPHDWRDVLYDIRPPYDKVVTALEVGFVWREREQETEYEQGTREGVSWKRLFDIATIGMGYGGLWREDGEDPNKSITTLTLGSSPYIRQMLYSKVMPDPRKWLKVCPCVERLCLIGTPSLETIHRGFASETVKELWLASLDGYASLEMLDTADLPNLERLTWMPRTEYSRGRPPSKTRASSGRFHEAWAAEVLMTFPLKHLGMINFDPEPWESSSDHDRYKEAEPFWAMMEHLRLPLLESFDFQQGAWGQEHLERFFASVKPEQFPRLKSVEVTGTDIPEDFKPAAPWEHVAIIKHPLQRRASPHARYCTLNE